MAEHPKETMDRLAKLVENTDDHSESPTINSTEAANDADPIKALEAVKRKRGRPKGSINKNVGFKKKDLAEMAKASKVLWNRNLVSWKLKPEQKCLEDSYKNRTQETLVWVLSRQFGKSVSVGILIIEDCMQNPGLRVAYICPLKSQAESVVQKNFNIILADCPEHLKPRYHSQKGTWTFSNGSIIKVAGIEGGHTDNLRGQTFDKVIIDEAGFPSAEDIEYVIEDVIYPTMTTSDHPLLLLISTPPKTFDHPFNDYWDEARADGSLVHRTLYDSWLDKYKIQSIVDRYEKRHGANSISFRREYMGERIADVNSLVVPEATPAIIESITVARQRPDYYKTYVSADWGVMDNNVILFGYLDWVNQEVVIEDELVLTGVDYDTSKIADAIKHKEQELWGEFSRPNRYCDNNLQIIRDLSNLHKLNFLATAKDNKQAAVNQVRTRIAGKAIAINPRCTTLLNHLPNATWDKTRTKFRRAVNHHYDALDALIYFIRNVDFHTNPFPANHFMKGDFISPKYEYNKPQTSIGKFAEILFSPKRKKR